MMVGSPTPRIDRRVFSLLRTRTVKNRTLVVGLKSDNRSRELLMRLLTLVVTPGDNVLAVHVQQPNDSFDPNTFHIHEDLCRFKQVDFQVKVCVGDSYISELTHQVRVNFATILALGCSTLGPKDLLVANCLKGLPPTCSLLVMDNGGKILIQRQGTSQQGSTSKLLQSFPAQQGSTSKVLQSSLSYPSKYTAFHQSGTTRQFQKSSTMPCPSTSSSMGKTDNMGQQSVKKTMLLAEILAQKPFQRLALLEAKGSRRFTKQQLNYATKNFSPVMVIGEGGHSTVYRANLEDGQAAAIKVLKTPHSSADDLLQEVELLSGIQHENIVQIIGYCHSKEMNAVVYNLQKGNLKQKLRQLRWNERMGVAIGVAKALEYLHHSCNPPIIHRDVKSSNILLSGNCQPQLSDFGAAIIHHQPQQAATKTKPFHVIGTFGYLAPECIMYGKVDEKIDVYSYGVVLLELITGKEAIQTNQTSNHESLVLWARSLLSCGLCERLIDPDLNDDYNKEELKTMTIAARLCLMHSSSRRPTMKTILKLFQEPEYWLKKQREREEFINGINCRGKTGLWRQDDSDSNEILVMDDL